MAKNKLDEKNYQEQMNEFCHKNGFAGWFGTSAKENINIKEATKFLVKIVKSKSILYYLHFKKIFF